MSAPARLYGGGGSLVSGLVSAALFAGLPCNAAAEPYASFEALCVVANGDVAATEVAAQRMGWRTAPAELIAGYSSAGRDVVGFVEPSSGRASALDGETVVHFRGAMTDPAGAKIDASMCMLFGRSSLSGVQARIEAWAGPGQAGEKGDLSWAYTMREGAVGPVAGVNPNDYNALQSLLKDGPVYVLGVTNDAGETAGLWLRILRQPLP